MTFLYNSALCIFTIFFTLMVLSRSDSTSVSPSGLKESSAISYEATNKSTVSTFHRNKEDGYSTSAQLISSSSTKTYKNHSIDEVLSSDEHSWWFKDAIKDIAYYLRAHKFNEYDRRYNRNGSQAERTNFEYFPKPPLRALHWEVNKYCEPSFVQCVDYLRKKLSHVALKRQDDTSIVLQENKWGENTTRLMSQIDMECRRMRNVDDLVAPPFEGPLEKYQWRTTASYFMCWYTINEVPDLRHLEEQCDNFAYCLDLSFGPNNHDPRADDRNTFACAQYSFCPDPCCANKHLAQMDFCWNDEKNPCFYENSAGQRECFFNRTQNTDFSNLILNRWNVTCKCPKAGYIWSSLYGICVDINECTTPKSHGCNSEGQACMNLPGSFTCICKWGYIYSEKDQKCVSSRAISELKLNSQQKNINETKNKWKVFVKTVVRALGKSSSPKNFGIYGQMFSTNLILSIILVISYLVVLFNNNFRY